MTNQTAKAEELGASPDSNAESAKESSDASKDELQGNVVPLWTPRFWNGMTLGAYFCLLARGRFRISPSRWHLGLITLLTALSNSLLALIQLIVYGRAIAKTNIPEQPVFVIGHFRTGTTMLLEHLACDDQFCWPTTFQCFAPQHFLLTEKLIPFFMRFLLPAKRPIDNMQAGFDRPQEDEFALLSLSAPTIYHRIAFPNQQPLFQETVTLEDCDPKVLASWRKKLIWFYKAISLRQPGRLLIKSPLHTGRLTELLRMFPDAKFVHIVRHPYEVYPSIRNAWRVLELTQGFQFPDNKDELEEFVFETLNEMYRGFDEQSKALSPEQLCTIHYDDLVQRPVETMTRIYQQLSLGDFEAMRPALDRRLEQLNDYRTNRFQLDQELKDQIDRRWSAYAGQFK